MECKRVREELSAYLDGMLSAEDRRSVEAHLSSCNACSRDLSELKKTVEHVGELQEFEAPPWLKQKIMATVREGSGTKNMWQRLFYPLHIKVPLEVIAVALIAVTALYISQSVPPDLKKGRINEIGEVLSERVETPSNESAPLRLGDQHSIPAVEEQVPAASVPRKDQSLAQDEERGGEEMKTESVVADQVENTSNAPDGFTEEMTVKGKSVRTDNDMENGINMPVPTKESKAITGKKAGITEEDTKGIAPHRRAVVEGETERETVMSEPETPQGVIGRSEREDIILSVKDIERSSKDIEHIIDNLKGTVSRKVIMADRAVIVAKVEAGNLGKLIDELSKLGTLKEHTDSSLFQKNYTGEVTVVLESM